jgi:hypothetical protein
MTLPPQIDSDTPCRKCGYNLRGLNPAGQCPECGAAISISTGGDLLRYCDPDWLAKLARGAKLIVVGSIVVFLLSIAFGIVGAVIRTPPVIAVGTLIGFAAGLLAVAGIWLVTEPDPSGIGEDRYGTSRQIIRITLIIGLAGSVLQMATRLSTLHPRASLILGSVQTVAGIANVIGFLAQLQYFSKLTQRIPDASLTARANFLKTALPVSYGALTILGILAVVTAAIVRRAPAAGPSSTFLLFGCGTGMVAIAVAVFLIMYLLLVARLARSFNEQAHAARQMWHLANPNPSV